MVVDTHLFDVRARINTPSSRGFSASSISRHRSSISHRSANTARRRTPDDLRAASRSARVSTAPAHHQRLRVPRSRPSLASTSRQRLSGFHVRHWSRDAMSFWQCQTRRAELTSSKGRCNSGRLLSSGDSSQDHFAGCADRQRVRLPTGSITSSRSCKLVSDPCGMVHARTRS